MMRIKFDNVEKNVFIMLKNLALSLGFALK
jgi:hypothetical protein